MTLLPLSKETTQKATAIAIICLLLLVGFKIRGCMKPKPGTNEALQERIKEMVLDSIRTRTILDRYIAQFDSMQAIYEQIVIQDRKDLDSLAHLTADQQAQLLANKHGLHYQARQKLSTRFGSNSKNQ